MNHQSLTRKFLSSYEQKDLETIAEMLANDVWLRDWNLEVVGKEAVLKEFTKNFSGEEKLRIDIRRIYSSETSVAAEIEIEVGDFETLRVVDVLGFNLKDQIVSIVSYKGL